MFSSGFQPGKLEIRVVVKTEVKLVVRFSSFPLRDPAEQEWDLPASASASLLSISFWHGQEMGMRLKEQLCTALTLPPPTPGWSPSPERLVLISGITLRMASNLQAVYASEHGMRESKRKRGPHGCSHNCTVTPQDAGGEREERQRGEGEGHHTAE